MANKEQRERLFGIAHVLAMRAVERPPEERQAFIELEVEEVRREYAQEHSGSPISEGLADRMLKWTEAMVQILEEAGGDGLG